MKMFTVMLFAGILTLQARAQVDSKNAPEKVPSPGPTYSEMKDIWDKGRVPTEKEIEGKWMTVIRAGRATSCGSTDSTLYDPEGLINVESNKISFLNFTYVEIPGNEFTGKPSTRIFNVKSDGYLYKKQEYTAYKFQPKEPQFSYWVLGDDGNLTNDIYVELSCRLSQKSADKMVCKQTVRITNLSKYLGGAACNGNTFAIDGFVRVKPTPKRKLK